MMNAREPVSSFGLYRIVLFAKCSKTPVFLPTRKSPQRTTKEMVEPKVYSATTPWRQRPNVLPSAIRPILRYENSCARSQHLAMMTKEAAFRQAQKMRRRTPEPSEACRRHQGMEKSPAPRMLLMRLRRDGKTFACALLVVACLLSVVICVV